MKNKKVIRIVGIIIEVLLFILMIRKDFWKNVVGGHTTILEEFMPVILAIAMLCFVFQGIIFMFFPPVGEKNKDVKEEQMNKHESESTEKQPEQINNR